MTIAELHEVTTNTIQADLAHATGGYECARCGKAMQPGETEWMAAELQGGFCSQACMELEAADWIVVDGKLVLIVDVPAAV